MQRPVAFCKEPETRRGTRRNMMADQHSPARLAELVVLAHRLADTADDVTLPLFRRRVGVRDKGGGSGFDPVTVADTRAERAIRRVLAGAAPDHGVLGEELSEKHGISSYRWVIDPIDGTRAFMTGVPLWGTLIGLLYDGQPVLGLMSQPFTSERFWSAGRRAFMRHTPEAPPVRIKTRKCRTLADATLMTTSPDLFQNDKDRAAFEHVRRGARMTRFGGDCYAYCMLASGHVDLVIEAGLKSVDIVALIPIIEAAGGRVSSWSGESAIAGGNIVASGDKSLHDRVLIELERGLRR